MKLKHHSIHKPKKLSSIVKDVPFPFGYCPRCKHLYYLDDIPTRCKECEQRLKEV